MSITPPRRSLAERRMRLEQALASTRIEGHVPTPEFLADMEAMVTGQLSAEEVRRRVIERAQEADRRGGRAVLSAGVRRAHFIPSCD